MKERNEALTIQWRWVQSKLLHAKDAKYTCTRYYLAENDVDGFYATGLGFHAEPPRQSGSHIDGPAPPHYHRLASFPLYEFEKARKSPQQLICV